MSAALPVVQGAERAPRRVDEAGSAEYLAQGERPPEAEPGRRDLALLGMAPALVVQDEVLEIADVVDLRPIERFSE